MDPINEGTSKKIEEFIFSKCRNFSGAVIGISGGIDSALVATLAVRAIGPKRVHGLLLPANPEQYSEVNMQDARELAESLGVDYNIIALDSIFNGFKYHSATNDWCKSDMVKGNIMARLRMICLYAYANAHNCIVLGTTNKTEAMIGYYTKWGDGAVDIEPIVDLYKTEERVLAKALGVPEKFITKKPTADLWAGQTDEGEIGMTYAKLDEILSACVINDQGKLVCHDICSVDPEELNMVQNMFNRSAHKRVMPEGPIL